MILPVKNKIVNFGIWSF